MSDKANFGQGFDQWWNETVLNHWTSTWQSSHDVARDAWVESATRSHTTTRSFVQTIRMELHKRLDSLTDDMPKHEFAIAVRQQEREDIIAFLGHIENNENWKDVLITYLTRDIEQ